MSTNEGMVTREIPVDRLIPPETRQHADPDKLQRHGEFDWAEYTPIIVETDGTRFWLLDGMTRVENARRSRIDKLPAQVYERR